MRIVRPRRVIDTDVGSYLFNSDPVRGARYSRHLEGCTVLMPFIVVAEMRFGAENRNWGALRRARLEEFLSLYQVVQPTDKTCTLWAKLRAAADRSGRPIERQDAWIAAVALAADCPLVTHNAGHFASVAGLRVITERDR